MKIKNSFVTNSSSTSFVLTIETNNKNTFEDFFLKFKKEYNLLYVNSFKVIDLNYINLNKINELTYKVSANVFKYNDIVEDMPHWMKLLIIKFMRNELSEIKDIKLSTEKE